MLRIAVFAVRIRCEHENEEVLYKLIRFTGG